MDSYDATNGKNLVLGSNTSRPSGGGGPEEDYGRLDVVDI